MGFSKSLLLTTSHHCARKETNLSLSPLPLLPSFFGWLDQLVSSGFGKTTADMTKLFHITTSPLLSSSAKPNKGNPGVGRREGKKGGEGIKEDLQFSGGWLWTVAALPERP